MRHGKNEQEALLKEAIRSIVAEERVNSILETVVLTDSDIYALEEGRWDSVKRKLAAAGLAIACTATGCAPVNTQTGQPADPSELSAIGLDMGDLPPGEMSVDFDDSDSRSAQHRSDHSDEVPATSTSGMGHVNRAGRMGKLKVNR